MTALDGNIKNIKGIGEKKALAFQKLGVSSLYDLLSFFPKRYEDRSVYKSIALIADGEQVCINAIIATDPRAVHIRRGMDLLKFRIADESGIADVTYFNQSYLKNSFHKGDQIIFFGKAEVNGKHVGLVNPVFEREDRQGEATGRIIPVYRSVQGLNQKSIIQSIRIALNETGSILPDVIPEDILHAEKLARSSYAFENIHFPSDYTALAIARRRLIFEELFVLACALGKMRSSRADVPGIRCTSVDFEEFFRCLPYAPTGAQKRAIQDAARDMTSGKAMSRLVQGDVGSGKTLVAAAIAWMTWKNGYVSAMMAPTEILAEQHLQSLSALLGPLGIRCAKLTGSMSAKEKTAVRKQLADGEIDFIIGTHALFSDDVEYRNLGLVITDEQHRFGVSQRAALIGKADCPHVLVMSATPIPRTLALIIYGDLDVSIIDEMPPGRQTIDTFAVDSRYNSRINAFIEKQISLGHQVYIVCPAVEENEESNLHLKSAEDFTVEMQSALPALNIACVHGRLKAKEKDEIMSAFSAGKIDVLVATTVIEVGVDVPNATLIIIENAERFGLSQLHQLRGRVGRGKDKSYCILVSDSDGEDVRSRLDIMCRTNDGFQISEEDLRLRGPGDFFGNRQHGLPEMHVADLGADTAILKKAQDYAKGILEEDPELIEEKHLLLRKRIESLFIDNNERFN